MEDSKIIKLYWERSEAAISETAKNYGKYCYHIAFNILFDEQDSLDCVNDTYLSVWNSIPPHRPSKFKAFIGKIVRNLSINLYKKRNAERRGAGQIEPLLSELGDCIPSETCTFTDDYALSQIINDFLGSLSKEARVFFVRRYFYASSVKEIAEEYKTTANKVTVSLFRSREKLRTLLTKEGITI